MINQLFTATSRATMETIVESTDEAPSGVGSTLGPRLVTWFKYSLMWILYINI